MLEILEELEQINIEANVIIRLFYVETYFKGLYIFVRIGIVVNRHQFKQRRSKDVLI